MASQKKIEKNPTPLALVFMRASKLSQMICNDAVGVGVRGNSSKKKKKRDELLHWLWRATRLANPPRRWRYGSRAAVKTRRALGRRSRP